MDTIKREALIRAVKLLGWEPSDVTELHITPFEVTATLFERDEHGNKIHVPTDEKGIWTAHTRIEKANVS